MTSDNATKQRRLLGLGCGQPGGSAEILLKAALQSAELEGARVHLIRLDELRIAGGATSSEPDDAMWLWEHLVACDGLIISTPVISRTVPARFKLICDRLLGPNADAAIIENLLALQREGGRPAVSFRVDARVLKPRVAGFIAVGGALTSQWKTLALPILHTATFSMQIAVVDQVLFDGAGTLDPLCWMMRRSPGPHGLGGMSRSRLARGSRMRGTWVSPVSAPYATSTL